MHESKPMVTTNPPMAIAEADAFVSQLTDGGMRIVTCEEMVLLVRTTKLEAVRLLSFQLTTDGIREAVTDWNGRADA